MRVLLSFNEKDVDIAEAFRASLFVVAPDLEVFFSPVLFEDYRSLDLNDADAFLFIVGRHGLADSQLRECRLAIRRNSRDSEFVIVPVLVAGSAPEVWRDSNMSWIKVPVVTDRTMLQKVVDALGTRNELSGKSRTKKQSFLRYLRVS